MKITFLTFSYTILMSVFMTRCSIADNAKLYTKPHWMEHGISKAHKKDTTSQANSYSSEGVSLIYNSGSDAGDSGMIIERRGDAIIISTFVN